MEQKVQKQSFVKSVQTSAVVPTGCSLMSRCPIIRNGGIRCQDHLDCKTYDYIMNGTVRID